MGERLQCCVPFCRRTHVGDGRFSEWLCRDHWRAVAAKDRAVYAAMLRRGKWFGWSDDLVRHVHRLWEKCRRQAWEAAL